MKSSIVSYSSIGRTCTSNKYSISEFNGLSVDIQYSSHELGHMLVIINETLLLLVLE